MKPIGAIAEEIWGVFVDDGIIAMVFNDEAAIKRMTIAARYLNPPVQDL
ncbi:MAG TPA: hypothetical protein VGO70_08250 [Arsenicitalea sp.]|jgi:hypothetical protein|nr:hypothetical protein [Arsenicitalea sp.]